MPQPSPAADAENVPSPCIQVCTLDAQGVCAGCLRSIEEIAEWGSAPAAHRRLILDRVARRRAALERRA